MDALECTEKSLLKQRLSSFSRSPSLKNNNILLSNSPIKLAEAGFECPQHAVSDEVFCKFCGLYFFNWEGESPLAVHRTLRPTCPFLNPSESPKSTSSQSRVHPSKAFFSLDFSKLIHSNNTSNVRRQLFGNNNDECTENNVIEQPFRPKHRRGFRMLYESHRVLTFLNPPTSEAAIYAKCGFVFNSDSLQAICVFCNVELEFNTVNSEFDIEMQHKEKSNKCPFICGFDVGNISRECERAIRDKARQNDLCRELNHSKFCCGNHTFKIKHPEFEELDKRIGTFQSWPMLQQDEFPAKRMAECGFYYTGLMDSVRCYSCGVCLRNWSRNADPFVQHLKASKSCMFMLQVKGQDFVNAAQNEELIVEADYGEMTAQNHGTEQDATLPSSPGSSSPSSSSSSPIGSPVLDMAAIKAATCQYTIEQIDDAVDKFFNASWGLYPNEELLLGTLKAADENHKQICQQREEIINTKTELEAKDSQLQVKDSQLQVKDSVIQAKESVIQATYSQLQAKDRELAVTRQSLQHQVREELEQMILHKDEVIEQNKEQLEQKDEQLEQKDEQLEQKDEQLEQKDEIIEQNQEQLEHQNVELCLKSREVEDLKRHIQSLRQELRRKEAASLSRDNMPATIVWDLPINSGEEFPVARCTVCLSNPSQIVFQPCGHLCCCDQCASRLYGKKCPICRETNRALDKVYVI